MSTVVTLAGGGQATLDNDGVTTAGLTDTAGTPTYVLLAACAVSVALTVTAAMATATAGTIGVLRVATTFTTAATAAALATTVTTATAGTIGVLRVATTLTTTATTLATVTVVDATVAEVTGVPAAFPAEAAMPPEVAETTGTDTAITKAAGADTAVTKATVGTAVEPAVAPGAEVTEDPFGTPADLPTEPAEVRARTRVPVLVKTAEVTKVAELSQTTGRFDGRPVQQRAAEQALGTGRRYVDTAGALLTRGGIRQLRRVAGGGRAPGVVVAGDLVRRNGVGRGDLMRSCGDVVRRYGVVG
ncbi:hypothetical protein ACFV2H_14295 [Streptomyces sp. NPDC059629]|uniref:hypothetical protein n=1 Tax=Streptomyces sp. NPDC059629 TaxID=3346889 RepID=UPI00369AFA4A